MGELDDVRVTAPDGKTTVARVFGNAAIVTTIEADGTVANSAPAFILEGGSSPITRLAFSPKNNLVAAVGNDSNKVNLWSLTSGKVVRDISVPPNTIATSVAFNSSGSDVAIGVNNGKVYAYSLGDVDNGITVFDTKASSYSCNGVVLSACGNWIGAWSEYSPLLWFWYYGNDEALPNQLTVSNDIASSLPLPSGFIAMEFSEDGKEVAARSSDGRRFQWSTETGTVVKKETPGPQHLPKANIVAVDNDGVACVSVIDGVVGFLRTSDDALLLNGRYDGVATCTAISPGRLWIAVASSFNEASIITVFRVPTATHAALVTSIAFNEDGSQLVTATASSKGSDVNLWQHTLSLPSQQAQRSTVLDCTGTIATPRVPAKLVAARSKHKLHVMCISEDEFSNTITFDVDVCPVPVFWLEAIVAKRSQMSLDGGWTLWDAALTDGSMCWYLENTINSSGNEVAAQMLWRLRGSPQFFPDVKGIVRDSSGHVYGFLVQRHESANVMGTEDQRVPVDKITELRRLHHVASALLFMHSRNCVHNNVRLSSLIQTPSTILLGGFEYSFMILAGESMKSVGTRNFERDSDISFAAPELLKGDPATKSSDVFSFGKMLQTLMGTRALVSAAVGTAAVLKATESLSGSCIVHNPDLRPDMNDVVKSLEKILMSYHTERNAVQQTQLYETSGYIHRPALAKEMPLALSQLSWEYIEGLPVAPVQQTEDNICFQFISDQLGTAFHQSYTSTRMFAVGASGAGCEAFINLHRIDGHSRRDNITLQSRNLLHWKPSLDTLKKSFVDNHQSSWSRVLLGWHGTTAERVWAVCRDRPRSIRDGSFGNGSYFALEAWYASRIATTLDEEENAVILFAISVVQTKIVTLDDYERENPLGVSKFYGAPLEKKYDSHFIPVRHYGFTHPVTTATLRTNVGYQATDESTAEAHEIVVGSHHSCIPLAVVFFKRRNR
ncbi:Hypothetical protein, putative [Bodo saltans]|uniref:Serine-threonine/tyrosine-protein kinase catalytic domain-containing protein n=1 Tax=Bodo saltans TaxID=75058 RepID=A0A0S4J7K2_BODSA|nr:Hypothetical protein, putative [Bodo saltans]|eukprot:CUG58167.1 Hypothetical protein, putative [Bodo saltans]